MRKLVVGAFLTLDGVMQAPGGPDEDREGGFAHGGWSVKYWDDMMGKLIVDQTLKPDALLNGTTPPCCAAMPRPPSHSSSSKPEAKFT